MKTFALSALIFYLTTAPDSLLAGPLSIDTLRIEIKGSGNGTDARFEPAVVKVQPGDLLEFSVTEGMHTVTAYHPDNRRPLRIPKSAKPFDSGLLKQGDTWVLKIETEGIFDYFCLPHERMGHAGRIVSGTNETIPNYETDRIPQAALDTITNESKIFFQKNTN